MGFFSKKKKPDMTIVWRNSNGTIRCLGDNCPQKKCDDICPVWLNTMGLTMLRIKQYDKAIEAFTAALAIAPDFLDVQNNLGTAYGMNDQHQEAYEAFLAAHTMKPDYDKALRGLIIAETKLGMTKDVLKHCDEYDQLPNCDSADLRKDLRPEPASEENEENYILIAAEFLDVGRKDGFIRSEGVPYVPELLLPCPDVCMRLIEEINEYGKTNPKARTTELSLAWCAFAGMGATYHWHTDWGNLSQTGVFEILTKERGVFEMDEYVLDCIGKPHESVEGQRLITHIMNIAQCGIFKMATKGNITFEQVVETAKAMYLYGMVLEMNALDMH